MVNNPPGWKFWLKKMSTEKRAYVTPTLKPKNCQHTHISYVLHLPTLTQCFWTGTLMLK